MIRGTTFFQTLNFLNCLLFNLLSSTVSSSQDLSVTTLDLDQSKLCVLDNVRVFIVMSLILTGISDWRFCVVQAFLLSNNKKIRIRKVRRRSKKYSIIQEATEEEEEKDKLYCHEVNVLGSNKIVYGYPNSVRYS